MKKLGANEYTITLDDDPIVSRIIQKSLGIRTISFDSAERLAATGGIL